jgi:hypothetical protein
MRSLTIGLPVLLFRSQPARSLLLAVLGSLVSIGCTTHDGNAASGERVAVTDNTIDDAEVLDFSIREGQIYNRFFRQGPVAAHTVLTSGDEPRLIVAFPAGNSGVSLWFKPLESEVHWSGIDKVRGIRQGNRDREPLYGIETEISVDAAELTVDEAVLGSVRIIRNYLHSREVLDSTRSELSVDDQTTTWYRDRLDGRGGYKLSVEVLEGSLAGGQLNAPVVFKAPADGDLRLRVVALSGDKPLTPIAMDELLTPDAAELPVARQVLAYLSYEEKLLAGSWRFCTYFGRDTLMSIRLMMPALTSTTIEAGLGSVLARLNALGEVAHEEDIGEYAVLRRGGKGRQASDEPLYDYQMVDDDYMLAPIAAHYLLDHAAGRDRAAAFLRKRMANGQTHGEALVSNLHFVVASAQPFAREPTVDRLIKLKADSPAGNWRDSREGLGYGKIPYDVNAIWVPAALEAIARLHESNLLAEYASADAGFDEAAKLAEVWTTKAPLLFEVSLGADEARQRLTEFAESIGVPDRDALSSLHDQTAEGDTKLTFNAVSLDEQGNPVPVLNSDDGFALLFGNLSPSRLDRIVTTIFRPFPAGLLSPVGVFVANPAYASSTQRQIFTSNHYHGMTVWSWHQALLAAGLERQLRRSDLPAGTHHRLIDAQSRLWQVISSTRALQNSELWSWSIAEGDYRVEPFGQRSDDETESNAAQLWSTVFLGIPVPQSAE